MKEHLKEIVSGAPNPLRGRRMAAEYCQARVLQFLQEAGAFQSWVFHGGTALRFLYNLPRYSEDLDFALMEPGSLSEFSDIIRGVQRAFQAEAYSVDVKPNDEKTVKSAFLRFRGLLHELGLSPHASEVLAIKVEIDTNPPAGGMTETSIVRRYALLNLLHHDRPSLLAGKLHAVLSRPYIKGRDLYDLFWYLSDASWPAPNLVLLGNALRQTGWQGPDVAERHWALMTADRVREMDWQRVIDDVRPFLEREAELALLTREHVLSLLTRRAAV